MDYRTGIGYDVHRLVTNRKLIIGGVDIPYERGLLGHSDADVLTHAIIDALLGAMGKGDIGQHFPDTDEKYNNISSLILLENTRIILEKENYEIVNIDTIIIAQKPKLNCWMGAIQQNISAVLHIDSTLVNLKATTEEGLGFTGEGLGIAAKAICLLKRKK